MKENVKDMTVEELENLLKTKKKQNKKQNKKLNGKNKVKKPREKVFNNANVMDYLVATCILSIIMFTIATLYFYYKEGTPPPEQITALFFSFFGGELIAMAGITITSKITKNRQDKESYEEVEWDE